MFRENGDTLRTLSRKKYGLILHNKKPTYFVIALVKGTPGWTAIDSNENQLFQIFGFENEVDELHENKIRIINSEKKVGFANEKGKIIIKAQFDTASPFSNGYAIVGQHCKNIPWSSEENHSGCNHYSVICKSYGYINSDGKLISSNFSSKEEVIKKINWKSPYLE